MKFTNHVKNLEGKAKQRLNLLKRLAGTSWGADKNTLRQLYLSYVRSILDQNRCLQAMSSKTDIERLDKIQNQALRFISGALRSTPTAACEIHRNVEPLRLRREAAVVECVERYKRKDKNHPNAKLVENWKPTRRLQRKSILDVAQDLQEKYHLPENREVTSVADKLPPPYICNASKNHQ